MLIGGQRFLMAAFHAAQYSFLQAWPDVHLLHISTARHPFAMIDAGADPALRRLEDRRLSGATTRTRP